MYMRAVQVFAYCKSIYRAQYTPSLACIWPRREEFIATPGGKLTCHWPTVEFLAVALLDDEKAPSLHV